jgi:hypothetical protein
MMANNPVAIRSLPVSGALDGTEDVPIEKAGVTVRTTTQDIADLGGGGGAVDSVNGKVGVVVLTAADVGAVSTVNGQAGVVVLVAADVGALPSTTTIDTLLPNQAGQAGKFLSTDGANASWQAGGGGGGAQPDTQIVYGTGVGETSSDSFTYSGISGFLSTPSLADAAVTTHRVTLNGFSDAADSSELRPADNSQLILHDQDCWAFKILVAAIDDDTGDEQATWHIEGGIRRGVDGGVDLLGANTSVMRSTAGAVAWLVNVTASTDTQRLSITVSDGDNGNNIRWSGLIEYASVITSI